MASTPCANCGSLVEPGSAFCGACGTATVSTVPIPGAPDLPSPSSTYASAVAPTPPPPPLPYGSAPAQPPPVAGSSRATVPPVYGRPVIPVTDPGPPPVSTRNVVAGVLALVAVLVVFVGTFLPIIEFDFVGASGNTVGWGDGINDGPIHTVVLLLPLVAGVLSLLNRARVLVKVLLIVSAFIGFFWVAIRFADISGSLEDESLQSFVAQAADPGIGLYLITAGWVVVLVAGLVCKAGRPRPPFA